jgi:type I restriction enzyme S subunit
MGDQKDTAVMGNYLKQIKRQVMIEANKRYKLLGVKWYGKGMFLREEKLGKEIKAKKLYRVQTGDFLYNRLFAWKSSFAIVEEDFDGCFVSNEFPTFEYDQQKINAYFLLSYILQPAYIDFVNRQSGGMSSVSRKRFKEEDFVRSAFPNYTIDQQRIISGKINKIKNNLFNMTLTFEEQLSYLSSLRQSVLQEAIEGKLTAEWRKKNPELISGENHASKLLEKIRAEKERLIKEGKIKKYKSLSQITDMEKPFVLPEGSVWCRLGEAIVYTDNLDVQMKLSPSTIINYVDIDSIDNKQHKIAQIKTKKVSELSSRARRVLKKGYIVYSTVRPYLENIAFVEEEMERFIGSTGFNVFKALLIDQRYIFNLLLSPYINKLYKEMMVGFNSPSITNEQFERTTIPLPPLAEQQAIVERVEKLMIMINELEKQVAERKRQSERLMQSVLREAFKG